jgi:hypothetical protein
MLWVTTDGVHHQYTDATKKWHSGVIVVFVINQCKRA